MWDKVALVSNILIRLLFVPILAKFFRMRIVSKWPARRYKMTETIS